MSTKQPLSLPNYFLASRYMPEINKIIFLFRDPAYVHMIDCTSVSCTIDTLSAYYYEFNCSRKSEPIEINGNAIFCIVFFISRNEMKKSFSFFFFLLLLSLQWFIIYNLGHSIANVAKGEK